jgi:hypothetical protein
MTEVRIRSWTHLNEVLFDDAWDQALGRFRSNAAFRGLSRADYDLSTSLMRLGGEYPNLERHLLRNFTKYAHGAILETEPLWYWLAVGQHHGLPTRLLDWTFSPFCAVHFATSNVKRFNCDGVVWCVDYVKARDFLPAPLRDELAGEPGVSVFTVEMLERRVEDLRGLERLRDGDEDFVIFLEPPSLDARIVNQLGLFSMMSRAHASLDEWLSRRPELVRRVIIPAEMKWEIRDKLDEIGVTERVLFPGLDGLADWLRRYYGPGPNGDAVSSK